MPLLLLLAALAGCAGAAPDVDEHASPVAETDTPGALVWRIEQPGVQVNDVSAGDGWRVYVAGSSSGGPLIAAYDHDGHPIWSHTVPYRASAMAISATLATPGPVSVLLWTDEPDGSSLDLGCGPQPIEETHHVVSYDADGECRWMHTLSFPARDLVVDEDGNTVVVGHGPFSGEGYVARLDANGALSWQRTFTAERIEEPELHLRAVAADPDGNIYVAGRLDGSSPELAVATDTRGALVAKLTPDGDVAWARAAHTASDAWAIDAGRIGQVAVAGTFHGTLDWGAAQVVSTSGENDDVFIAKFATGGTPLFNRRVGGTALMHPAGVGVDNWGNVDVALFIQPDERAYPGRSSWSAVLGEARHDVVGRAMMLFKLSPRDGYREWSTLTKGTDPDDWIVPSALAVTAHNNRILVVGEENGQGFIDRYYQ